MKANRRKNLGFTMVEALVAIALLSIVALAATNSSVKSYLYLKRAVRNSLAAQLALDRMEALSAINPSTLAAGTTTETNLISQKVKFSRVTVVTVNTDGSRTVSVTVTGANNLGGKAALSNTFSLWGNT